MPGEDIAIPASLWGVLASLGGIVSLLVGYLFKLALSSKEKQLEDCQRGKAIDIAALRAECAAERSRETIALQERATREREILVAASVRDRENFQDRIHQIEERERISREATEARASKFEQAYIMLLEARNTNERVAASALNIARESVEKANALPQGES